MRVENDLLRTLSMRRGNMRCAASPCILKQKTTQTAEQLMRSRYSAFALQQIDYILETTALGQQDF